MNRLILPVQLLNVLLIHIEHIALLSLFFAPFVIEMRFLSASFDFYFETVRAYAL